MKMLLLYSLAALFAFHCTDKMEPMASNEVHKGTVLHDKAGFSIENQSIPEINDTISADNIQIAGFRFGASIKTVITKLGTPDSLSNKWNEMQAVEAAYLYYGLSSLSFVNDRMVSFSMADPSYFLTLSDQNIAIDDDDSALRMIFPSTYKQSSADSTLLRIKIGESDDYIMIHVKSHKIISMYEWSDY